VAPVFTGNWFNFGRNPSAAGPSGALQITGGTKTTHGSYTVHTFLGPGNLEITGGPGASLPSVAFLLVAGGGGGGTGNANEGAGGGGGGGVVKHPGYTISGPGTYAITVGEGGAHAPNDGSVGEDGEDTTFVASPTLTYTAKGGGVGKFLTGADGGSGGGGGGASQENPGGSATQPTQSNPGASNYGNAGGMGIHMSPSTQTGAGNGAGGGGAGGAGEDGTTRNGGPGTTSCTPAPLGGPGISIDYRTGSGATYAAGGEGGAGFDTNCPNVSKTANTGDGGDGSNPGSPSATPGASGICVFRFPNTVYNG